MKAVFCFWTVALAGCATQTQSVCHYGGMNLADRMAVGHCQQALARRGDYHVSSGNPYAEPRGTVSIQEQKYGIPTGRTYRVKP